MPPWASGVIILPRWHENGGSSREGHIGKGNGANVFFFCRLYPSFPSHRAVFGSLSVISQLLTNAVSQVRGLAISYDGRGFVVTKKKTSGGLSVFNSSMIQHRKLHIFKEDSIKVKYRALSCVFQNIDLPPPSPSGECVLPPQHSHRPCLSETDRCSCCDIFLHEFRMKPFPMTVIS